MLQVNINIGNTWIKLSEKRGRKYILHKHINANNYFTNKNKEQWKGNSYSNYVNATF